MSAPAISRHLKVLREAELVRQRAQGTHRLYSAEPAALRHIVNWTDSHKGFWTSQDGQPLDDSRASRGNRASA